MRRAVAADAAEVARVLAAGFTDDPIFTWVFDDPGRREKLEAMFGFMAPEGAIPLGATFHLPGAVACWTPPDSPAWPKERFKRFVAVLVHVASSDELTRLTMLENAVETVRPRGSSWRLASIAVLPDHQGQGLGSTLVEAGLDLVDSEGYPAHLESTNPRNVPLYERFGFEVTEHVTLGESGPTLTGMVRPARR